MDTSVSITVGSTTLDEDQEDVRFDTLSLQIAQNLSQKLSRAFREVFLLFSPRDPYTVEVLLTDTLVSGQLYLRPPCLKPRFNSHTNSVFLRSRKRTFP